MELWLGFAPQMIDNQLFVHALDLKKTVQPLLSAGTICPTRTNGVIAIDPGHGGEDSGAKSSLGNRYEKEFTLDWARRLASLLTAKGWRVYLTRVNDSDLALSNRVAVAEQLKADLFVSLHFNSAAPNEEQAGLETYCLTPTGMPSSLTRGFEDDSRLTFPNNSFDGQNLQVACVVHRALLRVNGNHDRGVRRARFPAVLRGQQRPAILIEGGYLSNRREARLISEPIYRQKLAQAVANGIEEVAGRDHDIVVNTDDKNQRSEISPENLQGSNQRPVAR
jgi:N-acetylmuramoyl-L-alanine amidase